MKKSKRNMIAIMLIIAMTVMSMTGCGSKETSTKDKAAVADDTAESTEADAASTEIVPEDGAKLTLWMDNDDYNAQIVDVWEEKYPDIPLTVERVGTTDARGKIELDGPSGMGADVFVQPHDGVAISAESGLILELDKYTDYIKENYMENSVTAVTYKDKIFAFPLSMKTIALFYNKALVDKPVTTWDEMKAFAKEYNDPSKNKFAILWQAVDSYFDHGFLAGYGYNIFGETHDDVTKLNWDTPEALEGMKFYQSLNQVYPVKSADATWDAMNSMFSAGEAPYVITGPWSVQDFKKAGVDFGVTQLPTLPNGKQEITFSTVDTACVSSYTQYPNAAMLLAKFLTDKEGLTVLYNTKNELPASKAGQQYDFILNDEYLKGIAEQAKNSIPMPYIPEMASVWTPYANAFTAVWDNVKTPEDALASAIEEFQSSVKK